MVDNRVSKKKKFKIGLLCGGPSLERGISLNSARSIMDHLQSDEIIIHPIYFNHKKEAFLLSPSQLYSNTPSDFDFKISQMNCHLSESDLEKELKSVDIVFSAMHGPFGEDGTIQKWLEARSISFVGSSSYSCKKAFDKFIANEFIKENGFYTLPSCLLKIHKSSENKKIILDFFEKHKINRAIVKPASGGSSIGVFSVNSAKEALEKAEIIFSKRMDKRVVVEPFAKGKEFTVIILQNKLGQAVAILPTEIETDYQNHQIFDFRKKYLPSRQVTYHCPPRFDDFFIESIQAQAEKLFTLLKMSDFARFDGWVLDNGEIWFSDFNPISGMEQNSFLFQQSARIGLSHRDVLQYIIARSCDRQNISHPFSNEKKASQKNVKKPLAILMGGKTSERQVSLMSGTNVWLKLRNSKKYEPIPYLMDLNGKIWKVPYQLLLNHTVEEIIDNCKNAQKHEKRVSNYEKLARIKLGLNIPYNTSEFDKPKLLSLKELLKQHRHIFIALHGGKGEDGRLQALLEKNNIKFNGPSSKISSLSMDKQKTQEAIENLSIEDVFAIPGTALSLKELNKKSIQNPQTLWEEILKHAKSRTLIAKPSADGCSSGVVHLHSSKELALYISLLVNRAACIEPNTFKGQLNRIEMPLNPPEAIRFEKYIATDKISIKAGKLIYIKKSGFVEITIGVVEDKNKIHSLNPSITVASSKILSVEEKFQGGTGVNLTPPPHKIMSKAVVDKVKRNITKLVIALDLHGYSRIDAFVNCQTGSLYIIEINTLPALTPSTVIFHQALAEEKAMHPIQFLELIADNK